VREAHREGSQDLHTEVTIPLPLKILTWNIWLMPRWLSASPKNLARAAAIADELLARDYDIVCLEKVFDDGARTALTKTLGARYPHRYGPLNRSGSPLKINGGVWVLSRTPLTWVHEIQFRDSNLTEGFSRKGAMLLRGSWQGQPFQLIATHLQGEEGPRDEHQPIRDKQMAQIARELIAGHADRSQPLFVCGDFGTQRRDRIDPFAESASYLRMLATFAAVNGQEQRVTLDDRRVHNDLANYDTGRVAELDYILLHCAGHAIAGTWQAVVMRHPGWDGPHGRRDLSYRYAVGASFVFS
jgi:endonuclease/exonuclease/phosphatase family metal-dependent hydrolase